MGFIPPTRKQSVIQTAFKHFPGADEGVVYDNWNNVITEPTFDFNEHDKMNQSDSILNDQNT